MPKEYDYIDVSITYEIKKVPLIGRDGKPDMSQAESVMAWQTDSRIQSPEWSPAEGTLEHKLLKHFQQHLHDLGWQALTSLFKVEGGE